MKGAHTFMTSQIHARPSPNTRLTAKSCHIEAFKIQFEPTTQKFKRVYIKSNIRNNIQETIFAF